MALKSILLASIPMVLSERTCPGGAMTVEYRGGLKKTFPLDPTKCHYPEDYANSKMYECIDDSVLIIHYYPTSDCDKEQKIDQFNQTITIGETFSDNGMEYKLINLECNNACNCDYIEYYEWTVGQNDICGYATDHIATGGYIINSHIITRSETFNCLDVSGLYDQKSLSTEIYGCKPRKTVGSNYETIGKWITYNGNDCSGSIHDQQDIKLAYGDMKGMPSGNLAAPICRQLMDCDGMKHTVTKFDGVHVPSDDIVCSNAAELLMSAPSAIILLLTVVVTAI